MGTQKLLLQFVCDPTDNNSTMRCLRPLFIVGGFVCLVEGSTSALGPYAISDVTVSGISSGGYMAVQLHVSHSSVVNGSAIFAGVS